MTMPVFALLTPLVQPQPQTLAQSSSALTDVSEEQQSYSEDLAVLLAEMESALTQLDEHMQQIPEVAEAETQDAVLSMLPQPLLFNPMLRPAELTEPATATATPMPILLLPADEPLVLSSAAMPWRAEPKAVAVMPSSLPLQGLPVEMPAVTDVMAAPQKTSDVAFQNSTAFLSSLNQNQTSQLHPVARAHQPVLMADLLPAATGVAPAQAAATSALPVWQADPMPAQSQQLGQRLVQMLADKVDLQLGLNVNKAMIRLDPPSLGSIELSVQLDGERLTVQMHSSNAQLREAMGQGLEQLRASLQQKLGADVQIDLRMGSDSSSQQQQHKFAQQGTQQPESNFHAEAEVMRPEFSQASSKNLINQLV